MILLVMVEKIGKLGLSLGPDTGITGHQEDSGFFTSTRVYFARRLPEQI